MNDSDTSDSGSAPAGFELVRQDNTFLDVVGPIYSRRVDKRVTLYVRIARTHINPAGIAHGGLLMTLMDVTLGMNAGAHIGHEGVYPTVQLNCNMMAAAREGDEVMSEATVEQITRTLAFMSGRLKVGERTILTATAVFRNPPGVEIRK